MGTQVCKRCKEVKHVEEFYKVPTVKTGLHSSCKECLRQRMRRYNESYRSRLRVSNRLNAHKKRKELSAAEKAAQKSTDHAVEKSTLSTVSLFNGSSWSEAVKYTIPFAEERLRLEAETGQPHHIDHIKPICAGGLHIPENLQVLTASANMAKGPVWFEEDLTDADIERLDQEALSFQPSA